MGPGVWVHISLTAGTRFDIEAHGYSFSESRLFKLFKAEV